MIAYSQYLNSNPYPGRGILLGVSADGSCAIAAYFLMGRSANSRNRVFRETADGIVNEPYDPAKVEDSSLILYTPVRACGDTLIVSNGVQTDTIYETLRAGGEFHEALLRHSYEPDAPHYTPRISGLLYTGSTPGCQMSILYRARGSAECVRLFFRYFGTRPGTGVLLHTYAGGEGGVLQPFSGAPVELCLPEGDAAGCADALWDALDAHNRVALYVRYTPYAGGAARTAIRGRF